MRGTKREKMTLYHTWCNKNVFENDKKQLWILTEHKNGRKSIEKDLATCIRSHYDKLEQIAEDVRELGYPEAATILAERMPNTPRARSGDLGEILATELVEEFLDFKIPVRRLRYKDGREMALRGDDFIGVQIDEQSNIRLLKGESKSRADLTKSTITDARKALSRDNGRPTATSLLFIADRLMESNGELLRMGRAIRNEVAKKTTPASRITHMLFSMSSNKPPQALRDDLEMADDSHPHISAHLRIEDHQAFINTCYEKAKTLGND